MPKSSNEPYHTPDETANRPHQSGDKKQSPSRYRRRASSAVGMAGLPLRAPVEVEMIVELND